MKEDNKALYFTRGVVPTEHERKEAEELNMRCFRNSHRDSGLVETGISRAAGLVPDGYAKAGVRVTLTKLVDGKPAEAPKVEQPKVEQPKADVKHGK
jgi:hypothetical protein